MMAGSGLHRLSATALLAGYKSGAFTPDDVVDDILTQSRIADQLCNFATVVLNEEARVRARELSSGLRRGEDIGPLGGVPVTVKDLIFTKGARTMGGSPHHAGFVPDNDSAAVARLRDAGAVIIAKTTTSEAGHKLTADSPVSGITRNPWNPMKTSGGSSGGAAVAVACGCGPLALATDAVGSIRVPAAFCGVVGLKPTFGLIPRAPGFRPPPWASLVHTGLLSRTVSDAALMLSHLAGRDDRDPASLYVTASSYSTDAAPLSGLRVAASEDFSFAAVEPCVRDCFRAALHILADLGADVRQSAPSLDGDLLEKVLKPIAFTEQATAASIRNTQSLAQSDATFLSIVDEGLKYSGTDYIRAGYARTALQSRFLDLFSTVDVLVTPTVAITAFPAGEIGTSRIEGRTVDRHLGWSPFTWPMNLTGVPALTVPCGQDAEGMPIGLQIVAPWLQEAVLFRVAAAFEEAKPWPLWKDV